MNTKIIRNFSMVALMLGAMFVLTSRKAQAQNYQCVDQCGAQMEQCANGTCESSGCNTPGALDQCYSQFDACMARCGVSL